MVLSLAVILGSLTAKAAVADVKVATVDVGRAMETIEAGKSVKAELEKDLARRQKKLQEEEEKLKKAGEEFQKQQGVLSEAKRNEKQAELQKRFMELQQMAGQQQNEMQKRQQDLMEPLIGGLREVIKDLASKKGYSLVLEKTRHGVLYSLDQDDLTDEVVKAFNAKKKK
jgi:outer membrane protein